MTSKSKLVPYFSFKKAPVELQNKWLEALKSTISEGVFIKGSEVDHFEKSWAFKLKTNHALGVSNGQDGLIIALRALGVKAGEKVLVPSHSFIATHNAIVSIGAIPVSVDVDSNGLLDVSLLSSVDPKVSAIIAVHMHGQVCDMPRILEWAKKSHVLVIEDASQAHLAAIGNKYAGTFGDVGVFSLYPTKNLGALGDAGVVVTDSNEIYEKMKSLSNYGSSGSDKYLHDQFGLNNRLDEIQAAILNVNVQYLDEWNHTRKNIAFKYFEGLKDTEVKFLQEPIDGNIWHHFCILHHERDRIRQELTNRGIGTEIHYPHVAANEYEKYSNLQITSFPRAEMIANQVLSLPNSQWHTPDDIDYVIKVIQEILPSLK
jgi:dTDP-4-amino-4,6-dideoxygalactose transaminase